MSYVDYGMHVPKFSTKESFYLLLISLMSLLFSIYTEIYLLETEPGSNLCWV